MAGNAFIIGGAGQIGSAVAKSLCESGWQMTLGSRGNRPRLLLGFGVVVGPSRHQACNKSAEQGFAAPACVVHELEEAEIERQLVLRDAPMRAKPGAQ